MKLSNIVPTAAEEEFLHLIGFFWKPKVGKTNISTFHDEKVDSGDDFESPILRKPKKVKFVSKKESLSIGHTVDDMDCILKKKIKDVVCHEPPSVLPPDRGVRHKIDLVPGTKYVTRQWLLPKVQCKVIDVFFRANYTTVMVRESKSTHSSPTFYVKKPNGKIGRAHV